MSQIGKFLETPNLPVVNTTCDNVLDKFTGCEAVFMAGKNAVLCSVSTGSDRPKTRSVRTNVYMVG